MFGLERVVLLTEEALAELDLLVKQKLVTSNFNSLRLAGSIATTLPFKFKFVLCGHWKKMHEAGEETKTRREGLGGQSPSCSMRTTVTTN